MSENGDIKKKLSVLINNTPNPPETETLWTTKTLRVFAVITLILAVTITTFLIYNNQQAPADDSEIALLDQNPPHPDKSKGFHLFVGCSPKQYFQ